MYVCYTVKNCWTFCRKNKQVNLQKRQKCAERVGHNYKSRQINSNSQTKAIKSDYIVNQTFRAFSYN